MAHGEGGGEPPTAGNRRDSLDEAAQALADAMLAPGEEQHPDEGLGEEAMAVADVLADEIGRLGGPARQRLAEILHQLGAIDRAVYAAVASVPAPALDRAMRRLSNSANNSKIWFAIAAALALTGPAGQRAAVRGVLAIGVTSAAVNLGVKSLSARRRPDRAGAGVPGDRHVRMPTSTSFPSGHSASAFAFATAISRDSPWLAVAIQFLAGGVAYSRVHTGVHYPGDTVAGALIGAGVGQAVSSVFDRAVARRRPEHR
jgi:undecaprenyl-diphosphatase